MGRHDLAYSMDYEVITHIDRTSRASRLASACLVRMLESTSCGDIKRVELFKKFFTYNPFGVQELGTWCIKLKTQFIGSQWLQHINPTTYRTVLLEKLLVPSLVKKFPTMYGVWRFITVFITACHLCLSWSKWIQMKRSHPVYLKSIFTFSSHPYPHFPSGLLPSGFLTNTCISLLPCT